jgi:hypothetical protein
MHGSILVIAKKKAAGPGAYFDPMAEHGAPGPSMFEMARGEEECCEEPEMGSSMEGKDVRDIVANLRAAAQRLEDMSAGGGEDEGEEEGEDEGEDEGPDEGPDVEEEPEEAPKAKTKKPFPGFGSKKEMKY